MNAQQEGSRSLTVAVPVAGLGYFGLFFILEDLIAIASSGSLEFFEWLFLPFAVLSLAAAVVILWRRPRAGYIAASAISAVLLVMYLAAPKPNDMLDVLSNPANTSEFIFHLTIYPALVAVLFYSILGLRDIRQRRSIRVSASTPVARTMIPRSGIVAVLVVGFILGGLVVGLMAGTTQARLLTASGSTGDVMIVQGAGSPSNGQFYSPASLTVKVGTTVTWVNHDSTPHTVTNTNGTFDSGNMDSGASYKFTFTVPGTYTFYCTYHSWMKGTIVVTSG